MHIPEGYKLVPVELLERVVCLDNSFRRHRQAQHDLVTFLAVPVPPQVEAPPVYYEFEWASAITADGPQNFKVCIERDPPPEWAVESGQGRNVRKLFTHSDAGVANSNHKLLMDGACGEIALLEQERDTLRAQLANAHRLLTYVRDNEIHEGRLLWSSIDRALSAVKEG